MKCSQLGISRGRDLSVAAKTLSFLGKSSLMSFIRRVYSVMELGETTSYVRDTWLKQELEELPSVLERLAWYTSLRNPHDGRYRYPKLNGCLDDDTVHNLLSVGHERSFAEWLGFTLQQQAADLALYFSTLSLPISTLAVTWSHLEPYRQFAPEHVSMSDKSLFYCELQALLSTFLEGHTVDQSSRQLIAALSARELEVLSLIGAGKTTKEIAGTLRLSCYTVADHRRHICHKLRIHSTAELIAVARTL